MPVPFEVNYAIIARSECPVEWRIVGDEEKWREDMKDSAGKRPAGKSARPEEKDVAEPDKRIKRSREGEIEMLDVFCLAFSF